jgi:flagellar hook-length control protein FliK
MASGSASESPMAGQTPFSIFFSGPAPGVESAASVLPKMILPAASSALRVSHTNGIDVPSANPQTSPQNGGLPSGIRQDLAPPATKELPPGTGDGNLQNAQPTRPESDGNAAASLQAVSPQSVTTPALATPASVGVTVPVSAPSAPTAGSQPQTAPAPALAMPATAFPLPPEPAALGSVQVAQLVSRLGQSEMRIGLNTSAFGSVEIRTTVRTSDVGLVIGSEKGDLRTLLANDMPAIASTLQQQNLRLNSVNFMQGFAFSNNASGGGDPQQRSFVPTRASADSPPSETTPDDSADTRLTRGWGGGSISILA